jgi:hypothetical protein
MREAAQRVVLSTFAELRLRAGILSVALRRINAVRADGAADAFVSLLENVTASHVSAAVCDTGTPSELPLHSLCRNFSYNSVCRESIGISSPAM